MRDVAVGVLFAMFAVPALAQTCPSGQAYNSILGECVGPISSRPRASSGQATDLIAAQQGYVNPSTLGTTLSETAAQLAAGGLGVYPVQAYGAVCDGVTDDTAAISAAIAATSTTLGGQVTFPKGQCLITGTLTVSNPRVHFRGTGMTTSTILTTATAFNAITIAANYFQISDLAISQTGAAGSTRYWAIYDSVGSAGDTLRNVQITGGHSGIYLKGTSAAMQTVRVMGIATGTGIGIDIDGNATVGDDLSGVLVANTSGTIAQSGIVITGCQACSLNHVQAQYAGHDLLVQPSAFTVTNLAIANSFFGPSTTDSALIDGTTSPVTGVLVTNSGFVQSSTGPGLEIKGTAQNVSVTGSRFLSNATAGLLVDASATVSTLAVGSGNIFAGNTGAGVHIGSGVSDFTLSGFTAGPAASLSGNSAGIQIDAGAGGDFTVTGNKLVGNGSTSTDFSNAASGTNQTVVFNLTD